MQMPIDRNRYRFSLMLYSVLGFIFWLVVIVGFFVLVPDLYDVMLQEGSTFIDKYMAAVRGLTIFISGLASIAILHYFRAVTENAAMTLELLAIARRQEHLQFGDNLLENPIID